MADVADGTPARSVVSFQLEATNREPLFMPGACLNPWQTDSHGWSIGCVLSSLDWIERGIFIALALMLAYTIFVLIRFSRRYYLARRESLALVDDSLHASERGRRTFVADLSYGLLTLKAITSAAPFLGLAGTSYGILASLFVGFSMETNTALRILSVNTAATLITAAAGILVAIPAIMVHNFLHTCIERFEREFSRVASAGIASHEDTGVQRQFRFAQTLPLKRRFSSLPWLSLRHPLSLASSPCLWPLNRM